MKKLFGQYVSKDVYEHLVANPALARLGGTRRDMTVLFSDIRGFTTVSEKGQPEEIVRTLNEYFTRMVELVFRHQGTLDKFVGDMVMALFGAPLDDPDHADHAVETALEMVEELRRLNERWKAEGRPELDIGIGINTGPMIAGNIGSEAIMSYTVIGDAVNLGSRLESLNKQYGTRIIISEGTREHLKGAATCSDRSGTSSSRARPSRLRSSKWWGGPTRRPAHRVKTLRRHHGPTSRKRHRHEAVDGFRGRAGIRDAGLTRSLAASAGRSRRRSRRRTPRRSSTI